MGCGQANFVGVAAGFDGGLEGAGHAAGIGGDGDGGIDEDGVSAQFHRFGGVAGSAEAGVHDDGDDGLFNDDADLLAGVQAAIGADGGPERHDGSDAHILQPARENGVGVDVGEDDESPL